MRATPITTALRRAHVDDVERGARLLDGDLGRALSLALEERGLGMADAVAALGKVADPDLALLALVRLGDVMGTESLARRLTGPEPQRDRLLALLGGSAALGDGLITHPDQLDMVLEPGQTPNAAALRRVLLAAVGADPAATAPVAGARGAVDLMRVAYRRQLVGIAVRDLTAARTWAVGPAAQAREGEASLDTCLQVLPEHAAALADLAAAALEASLAIARAEVGEGADLVRLAVLGMGKTGGRELNYVSDVDVIYAAEPAPGAPEEEAMTAATRLATLVASGCSRQSGEPPLWEVDPNLRPEGRHGPLVRTVASHLAYYERWAKTWEFQALLKARHVAGDAEVAGAYLEGITPMVWDAVGREHFVEDAQAMRRRVEEHVPITETELQIKLGRGGLRDVEFSVQLLQLVHGRLDESLRERGTLPALAALAAGGYVGRDDAAELARCYRLLRLLEHRIQLSRMRRTHLMPTAEHDLRTLARSMGLAGVAEVERQWKATRRRVRALHEELFYRPLLPATASLSADDAALGPQAALERLAALGYRDAAGAVRHIGVLTRGVSRRAAIQRHLLPVMLGWFADGPDPDAGLLAFRKLSEELGGTHWYLKLLRDSGAAAERLARVLSSSRYAGDLLRRSPESVAWLGNDAELAPKAPQALRTSLRSMLSRRADPGEAGQAVLFLRRRELTRGAVADVLADTPVRTTAEVISPAADVALAGALHIARAEATRSMGLERDPAQMLIVALGRLGGQEIGYASDADVLFVHDPVEPGQVAERWAVTVATSVRSILGKASGEPPLPVDADLRPEGRNGPMTRSLASYAEYYQRWAAGWERQSLLRARPVAGSMELGERYVALIDPLRYPAGGIDAAEARELRRIKARVESERLPRGVPPSYHLKLGRGGLADVEWTVQLLALQHAHAMPGLRTPETLPALAAAAEAGLMGEEEAQVLGEAWSLATRIRNANVLWTGRTTAAKVDALPTQRTDLAGVARLLGYAPGHTTDLEEDWLRAARLARSVVEEAFYGE